MLWLCLQSLLLGSKVCNLLGADCKCCPACCVEGDKAVAEQYCGQYLGVCILFLHTLANKNLLSSVTGLCPDPYCHSLFLLLS